MPHGDRGRKRKRENEEDRWIDRQIEKERDGFVITCERRIANKRIDTHVALHTRSYTGLHLVTIDAALRFVTRVYYSSRVSTTLRR